MPADAAPARGETSSQQWLDASPDLSAWALFTTPKCPSFRETHPALALWGHLRIDPGLCGLDTGRARPSRVEIGCYGHNALWQVPLAEISSSTLAWHPTRPVVAGLAVRDHQVYPWVADYRARTVTLHDRIRAATSLTGLGGGRQSPLVWCGSRLVMLTPVVARYRTAAPEQEWEPAVYEATGPGHLAFPEGTPELSARVAVHVAVMSPGADETSVLTSPLVVRDLEPAPGGGHVLIEYLDENTSHSESLQWAASVADIHARGQQPASQSVPPESCWAVGGEEVLAWPHDADHIRRIRMRDLRGQTRDAGTVPTPDTDTTWWPIWHRGMPRVLATGDGVLHLVAPEGTTSLAVPKGLRFGRPCTSRDPTTALLLDCHDSEGRIGLATVDIGQPCVNIVWTDDCVEPDVRRVRAFEGDAGTGLIMKRTTTIQRLLLSNGCLCAEPATTLPTARKLEQRHPPRIDVLRAGERPAGLTLNNEAIDACGPLLLWVTAHEPDSSGRVTAAQHDVPHAAAYLDLVLHWPADATVDALHAEITSTVHSALDTLAEHRPASLDNGVVVGGHSFGATLALYALAHVPCIDAAIAHSGCYNRTLTPTGFQYERRSYWQAPAIYHAFSAALFAHLLDRPVLIMHGTADTNPSTTPEQAIGLYQDVVAAGGDARLVLLPREGHNFQYAETHEFLAEEHRRWLQRCARTPERV